MPFSYDPLMDENSDENKNPGAAPQLAGGSQVTGSQTQAGAPLANAPAKPTSSGSFQNLQDYLTSNQQSGFGQQFAGKVNQDVNQANQAQQQSAQTFQNQSDAGSVKQNKALVDQATSDPYAFTQADPNNVASFQKQTGATYSGPTSFTDSQDAYQKAYGATQKASQTAQAAQTEGGRFALLDNYFGNPNYTQGQKTLDNLVVSGDPDAGKSLQQASTNANAAQSAFNQEQSDLSNYASRNRGQTEAAANYARNAINPLLTTATADQATALTNAQTTGNANYLNDQTALRSNDPTQWSSILKSLDPNTPSATTESLGGGQNAGYFGVNPGTYLSAPITANASNVASLQQQQRINALQTLSGNPLTAFDSTQAGTFDPSHPDTFDAAGYNKAITSAQNQYAQQEAPLVASIKQLVAGASGGAVTGYGDTSFLSNPALIQSKMAELNQLRSAYGLPPLPNPYNQNVAGPTNAMTGYLTPPNPNLTGGNIGNTPTIAPSRPIAF